MSIVVCQCRVKSVLRDVHVELELLLSHNGTKNYGDGGVKLDYGVFQEARSSHWQI